MKVKNLATIVWKLVLIRRWIYEACTPFSPPEFQVGVYGLMVDPYRLLQIILHVGMRCSHPTELMVILLRQLLLAKF